MDIEITTGVGHGAVTEYSIARWCNNDFFFFSDKSPSDGLAPSRCPAIAVLGWATSLTVPRLSRWQKPVIAMNGICHRDEKKFHRDSLEKRLETTEKRFYPSLACRSIVFCFSFSFRFRVRRAILLNEFHKATHCRTSLSRILVTDYIIQNKIPTENSLQCVVLWRIIRGLHQRCSEFRASKRHVMLASTWPSAAERRTQFKYKRKSQYKS